jgi:uncharacterized cupin superfamily protein
MSKPFEWAQCGLPLQESPINPQWILEGAPDAWGRQLAGSGDVRMYEWECIAGRFRWEYGADEFAYVIGGSAYIRWLGGSDKLPLGPWKRIESGDVLEFPHGCEVEWHIEQYIRKIAVLRVPLSAKIAVPLDFARSIKRYFFGSPVEQSL